MKAIVVAYGKSHEIGADNDLLWGRDLPDELRHFKELTTGGTVVMGRRTFESIGQPLPNRENIVVTRSSEEIEGAIVAHSLDEAYRLASSNNTFVIGGGQIYAEAINDMDILYITEVNASFDNATVFFPEIDLSLWAEVNREHHAADERNAYSFDFVRYEKKA
jgi:dihydrofolate reductase